MRTLINIHLRRISLVLVLIVYQQSGFAQKPDFPWPDGKRMALSLSFDDARASNPTGAALLNEYDVQATFYVLPDRVKANVPGWEATVKWGHEIANHSVHHPCSGNFGWTQPLEDYTMDRMKKELEQANHEIQEILGVEMVSYAYPCGQTTIGKGAKSQSFIPLISELFLTGREWLSEAPVDPWYCDMAALTGMKMDNKDFEEILDLIETASKKGQWLILAGHETSDQGNQTTYLSMLRQLCEYAKDSANGIWIAPVGTVGQYVKEKRDEMLGSINIPQITYSSSNEPIELRAINGRGIGPEIEYMPEWEAFGWFTGKDYVEWEMDVSMPGKYAVEMEWSVSDEESGKNFILETETDEVEGAVKKTGSWETFRKMEIGELELEKGYQKVVFRPAKEFKGGALLDLRKITFRPKK